MLYYPANTIHHAGVVPGVGGVAEHAFRSRPRGYAGYFGRAALEQDCSCATAARLLVKWAIFEAVGGFDETLPSRSTMWTCACAGRSTDCVDAVR